MKLLLFHSMIKNLLSMLKQKIICSISKYEEYSLILEFTITQCTYNKFTLNFLVNSKNLFDIL